MGLLSRFSLTDLRPRADGLDLARDAKEGLLGRPKSLRPVYFYDEAGSRLFEEITRAPEYYLTRTELSILQEHVRDIVGEGTGPMTLVELGSGSSLKTRAFIEALLARQGLLDYVPIDVSRSALLDAGRALLADYAGLRVAACAATYETALNWLADRPRLPALFLFLGSSVGNFVPEEARRLLSRVAASLREGDALVLGADLDKDPRVLEAAYNDEAGVTARFNLNLLARLNEELGATFRLEDFEHRAFYDAAARRVEMHLISRRAHRVELRALRTSVAFEAGESIHTEDSHKFALEQLDGLAARCGLATRGRWVDARGYFSVNRFERA